MKLFLTNLTHFLIAFLVVFFIYLLINKNKKNKYPMEFNYLINKYNLNMKKLNLKKLRYLIAFNNGFIISFTSVVIFNIDKFIWKLLVGFALLMTLIYSIYEIEGRVLKKREDKK